MNKMPCIAETLIQSERRNFAATTTDFERLRETQFGDLASLMNADAALLKTETAMQKISDAAVLLWEAGALYSDDTFADVAKGLADETSDLAAVRDRLREATQ